MEIMKWREKIVKVLYKKFSKKWSSQDRLLAIISQIADLTEQIQYEQGIRQIQPAHINKPIQYLIASVFVDLFVLCDLYNVDLDKELQSNLEWLQNLEEVR